MNVDEAVPARHALALVDVDVQRLGLGDEFGVEHAGGGEQVGLCRGRFAPPLAVHLADLFRDFGEEVGIRRVASIEAGERVGVEGPPSETEAPIDERDVALVQYYFRRVGIDPEVELGGGRVVAQRADRPTHHPDLVGEVVQVGFAPERERDIGERADTDQRHLARRVPKGLDDGVDGVAVGRRDVGVGDEVAAEAALAVDVGRVLDILDQRRARALVDRHVGGVREVEAVLGVLDFVLEGDVARDDSERFEVDRVGERREQDGLRVVAGGVGVEENTSGHGPRTASGSLTVDPTRRPRTR